MTSPEKQNLVNAVSNMFIFKRDCYSADDFQFTKPNRVSDDIEEIKHKTVSLDLGKLIQQGRQAKGLSQKDLAVKTNVKSQIINDYEAGRGIFNGQILFKIERVLGLKLLGPHCGKPIIKPTKKIK